MKRHTRLLALLLLAALLTGCGSKAQQPKEADAAVQPALPPEGITALTLSDDTQVLRFRRDGDIWYWQDDETFPLDQASMPALLEAAAAMTAAPSVPAGDDLSAYGLDDAKTSLSVTADGETLTFTRGDQAASGDWYLRCTEDGTVRTVSDDTVKVFQLLDGSIYDMAVLPTLPAITMEHAAHRRHHRRQRRPDQPPRGGRRPEGGQPRRDGGDGGPDGRAVPAGRHRLRGLRPRRGRRRRLRTGRTGGGADPDLRQRAWARRRR